MVSKFFDMDFHKIFPDPSPQVLATSFFNRLWRKLHVDNFSLLIIFYGRHRVGKSITAVTFAHILDETFDDEMEERIVYDSKSFIKVAKSIKDRKIKGGAIIFDEAGSGDLSNQRWYEEASKIISAELQAIGYLNPFIGFVTQNFSFINSTARRLSQGVFEVNRTNNMYSTVKPYWIETNPWIHGFYRRYPIFCENKNGVPSNIYKTNVIKISLPPKNILDRYIAHSQAFKDQLLSNSEKDIDIISLQKEKNYANLQNIEGIVSEVLQDPSKYSIRKRGEGINIDKNLIRHHFKLKYTDTSLVKALVDKKLSLQTRVKPLHNADKFSDEDA